MTWLPEVEEITRRRTLNRGMGGEAAIQAKHARGELSIRERIDCLSDAGTFTEIGPISASAEYDDDGNVVKLVPSNAVIGTAHIDGREVLIGGEDASIRGGASDGGGSAKGYYIEHLARELKLPLVRLHEGAGGSVKTNSSRHSQRSLSGRAVSPHADLLGTVPVVAAAMGACAGIVAARVAATHFSVMLRDTAFLFAGGPPVVERAIGRRPTKEELGGWKVHAYSGVVDNVALDEADALRHLLVIVVAEEGDFSEYRAQTTLLFSVQAQHLSIDADAGNRLEAGLLGENECQQKRPSQAQQVGKPWRPPGSRPRACAWVPRTPAAARRRRRSRAATST